MSKITYSYKGKKYLILYNEGGIQDEKWFLDQLNFAEKQGDWTTVKNRINGGLHQGYIKEI